MDILRPLALRYVPSVRAPNTEAGTSGLPGEHNGPADAYRHILLAAELTRVHGEKTARGILENYEAHDRRQPPDEADMDRHNNEIGIEIGNGAKTWNEVVEAARKKIMEAVRDDGRGVNGGAKWFIRSMWSGGKDQPIDLDPARPPAENPYGGEEHRFKRRSDRGGDAFDKPVADWTEDDVNAIQTSRAYRDTRHPDAEMVHAKVREWYVLRHGGGPVHVRAHQRGEAEVHAYDRSAPGG